MPRKILGIILIAALFLPQPAGFSEEQESEYISKIENLENSLYLNVQNSQLEAELAKTYLDYSSFLIAKKRFKEARDYLGMAKNLGGSSGRILELENDLEQESGKEAGSQTPKENLPEAPPPETKASDGYLIGKAVAFQFFEEAITAYKEKNYPLAEEQAKRVLEQDPTNKYAHELLGDIYYLSQNLEKAKHHWERSMTSENMARVKQKLSKVAKEIPAETSLGAAEEEHFTIRYDRSQKQYTSYQLKTLLRQAYRDIYQDLGVPVKGRVVVLLYDQDVFDKSIKPHHWSGALFDGKVRIPLAKGDEKDPVKVEELKKMIWHELGHVFAYETGGVRVPLWIQEGFAQFEENKIVPIRTEEFRKAYATGKIYTLAEIERGDKLFKGADTILLFYQQSFLMMKFMIKRYGLFKVREIVKAIGKGETFDSALLLILNVSPEDLERQWRTWLGGDL